MDEPTQTESLATSAATNFSPDVCGQLGWYVYALRDPRDGRVFYIGKGKGNRVFAHARDAAAAEDASVAADYDLQLSDKLSLITSIHNEGQQVEAFIIRHGLSSEKAAYEVEASVLDALKLLDPGLDNALFQLTNKSGGHHSSIRGVAGVEVVRGLYEAPPAPEISEPALLIKIGRTWTPTMSAHELHDVTRQWWKLGPRRDNATYALSVSRGIIREVYRIDPGSWESAKVNGKTRWRFSGTVDEILAAKYRNTSVRHLHTRGQASPTQYLNC